jgi:hypothetical protein
MSFWDTTISAFLSTLVAGIGVAAAAAVIALLLAKLFGNQIADEWERRRALRERDLAGAAEFYRTYGQFFAAWKVCESYVQHDKLVMEPTDKRELLTAVAAAEGALESFLLRLTLERSLKNEELDMLWCFRTAYKQLRDSVDHERRLLWWKSEETEKDHSGSRKAGFKAYEAFKSLAARVASLFTVDEPGRPPERDKGRENLEWVTGSGVDLKERYASLIEHEREWRAAASVDNPEEWEWVPVAESLLSSS